MSPASALMEEITSRSNETSAFHAKRFSMLVPWTIFTIPPNVCVMSDTIPNWRVLLNRGLHRKCPQCGQGDLFNRWFKLRSHCSVCGLKYLENQGDLWGILLFADRVLFMVPLIAVVLVTQSAKVVWPYYFGGALAIALIVTFPHRMGLSVALEYHIRRKSGDLSNQMPQ